jgi:hypothetical protein
VVAGEAHRWLSPARLQWLLDDGETTTVCRRMRQPRELEHRRRLHPDEGGRRGWSCTGAGVLRGDDEELDWLRNKVKERIREVRQVDAKRIEVRGGARAHCR